MTVNCVALSAFNIPPTSIMTCLWSILGNSPKRTSQATPSRLSAMMLSDTFASTVQNTKRTLLDSPRLNSPADQDNTTQ